MIGRHQRMARRDKSNGMQEDGISATVLILAIATIGT